MNADAKDDPAIGWQAGVTFDHAVLDCDGATHRIHHAAELDESAVAGPFEHPPVMRSDSRVDEVAAQRP